MSDAGPIIVKKKKIIAGGHHGGSWKVAYADFVTAMMAFFMVMWIMGMDADTRTMVAGYFNDPMGFVKNPPKSKSPFSLPGSPAPKMATPGTSGKDMVRSDEADAELLKRLKQQIEHAAKKGEGGVLKELLDHFEVEMTQEGLRLEFVESVGAVFFDSGQATIRPAARSLVSRIAPILAKSERPITIEGHTDAQPYSGTGYTNLDLSSDRAKALLHCLLDNGVPLKQFIEFRGYGASKLRNRKDPTHFSNRRVTILLPFKSMVSKIRDLPGDVFKSQTQAAFRQDIAVAPGTVELANER